jgi:hypothetical protein
MTNTEIIVCPRTDNVRIMLKTLNGYYGVSWNKLSRFLGVPVGTLWRIANGGKIPKKWKQKLGVYYNRKLYDMPVDELRWAIEHRQEY